MMIRKEILLNRTKIIINGRKSCYGGRKFGLTYRDKKRL